MRLIAFGNICNQDQSGLCAVCCMFYIPYTPSLNWASVFHTRSLLSLQRVLHYQLGALCLLK